MKKLLALLLSLLLTAALTIGLFACDNNEEYSSSENKQSASATDEEVEMPEGLTLVNNLSFEQKMLLSVSELSVGEVLDIAGGYEAPIILFNGITVGDIAQELLGHKLIFGLYSDGNWYSGEFGDEKFAQFNRVANALFNYKLGSGESLGLSKQELEMCGKNKVIGFVESQFGVKLENKVIDACPEDGYLKNFIPKLLQLTVNDLSALIEGDNSFFEEYLIATEDDFIALEDASISEIILEFKYFIKKLAKKSNLDLFFDNLAELFSGFTFSDMPNALDEIEVDAFLQALCSSINEEYSQVSADLYELLALVNSGTIANPMINQNATVVEVVVAYQDLLHHFVMDMRMEAVFDEIKKIYEGVLLRDLTMSSHSIKVDAIISSLSNVLKTVSNKKEYLIDSVEQLLKDLLSGTFSNAGIDVNVPAFVLVQDLKAVTDCLYQSEELSQLYEDWLVEVQNMTFADLLDENADYSINQMLTNINDFIVNDSPILADELCGIISTLNVILNGSIGEPELKADLTVGELLNLFVEILDLFDAPSADVQAVIDFANLYNDLLIEEFEQVIYEIKIKDLMKNFG